MIRPFRNAIYWALDYLYLIKTDSAAHLRAETPSLYRKPGNYPVIVIPGIYENWKFMRPILKVLFLHGYDVHVISDLGYNRRSIEDAALIIEKYILENGLRTVSIVAHSKGGLIGKYLLTSSKISVEKMITLNTPFSGSFYAYLFPFGPLKIFTPRSKILSLLALDRSSNRRIVSIYGIFDPHIPGGSTLEGATNIQLHTYGHFRGIGDTKVHNAIINSLKSVHTPLRSRAEIGISKVDS